MKKTYFQPKVNVLVINTFQMLASSLEVNKTELTGDVSGDAREFNFFDDEEFE